MTQHLALPIDLANALHGYLTQCPYRDVKVLIEQLERLQPVVITEQKLEPKKD